jgi:hypothetical protein
VKAWLSRAGVSFVVRNVDEDDRAYTELVALGFRTVPVTIIGTARVVGFDESTLATALRSARSGAAEV